MKNSDGDRRSYGCSDVSFDPHQYIKEIYLVLSFLIYSFLIYIYGVTVTLT